MWWFFYYLFRVFIDIDSEQQLFQTSSQQWNWTINQAGRGGRGGRRRCWSNGEEHRQQSVCHDKLVEGDENSCGSAAWGDLERVEGSNFHWLLFLLSQHFQISLSFSLLLDVAEEIFQNCLKMVDYQKEFIENTLLDEMVCIFWYKFKSWFYIEWKSILIFPNLKNEEDDSNHQQLLQIQVDVFHILIFIFVSFFKNSDSCSEIIEEQSAKFKAVNNSKCQVLFQELVGSTVIINFAQEERKTIERLSDLLMEELEISYFTEVYWFLSSFLHFNPISLIFCLPFSSSSSPEIGTLFTSLGPLPLY